MKTTAWNISDSRALYNVENWGGGYFDINADGEMTVSPIPGQTTISLYELANSLPANGLSLPVLVRFSNILHHRVEILCQAFQSAMQEEDYQASYTAVYPIKVNQQRHVVEEILSASQDQQQQERIGLEAGSKSELMAVLALAPPTGGLVICNGYKDKEYVRLALIGQQLGLSPYLVIEKASEVSLIIEESRAMEIIPRLGIRVRLASVGKGRWQNTGGEKGKFGLSASQVLDVIKHIKAVNLIDSLQLMHFHIGSQVSNIRDIQGALREAARYYAELHAQGVSIQTIDVGGGLGIDYDGTCSRSTCSINYNVQEYANNVVHEFWDVCNTYNLPHPHIITESGRAMTAHHAILITNIIDLEPAPGAILPSPATDSEPMILQDLWYSLTHLTPKTALEAYHDAIYLLNQAHSMFLHGVIDLTQRARAEQMYHATCWQVQQLLQAHPHTRLNREVLEELEEKITDKYFGNFSLFQSIPDAWGIDQVFPIMPLHRLNEQPNRRATLQDLTCDSDGQVEYYLDRQGVNSSLPLHEPNTNEPYLLGIFLIGAYQEILGDIHNLFGDTYSVNVKLTPEGSYELIAPQEGDTVQNMLSYVNFETGFLRNAYRKRLQTAPLTGEQRQAYQRELEAGLLGYTYLE